MSVVKLLLGPDCRVVDCGDVREIDGALVGPHVMVPPDVAPGFSMVEIDVPEDFQLGVDGWCYQNGTVVRIETPELLGSAARALADVIDRRVAEVYSRWFRFEAEYVAREAAARLYLIDQTPSEWVSGFAVPAGLSDDAAAALIVGQADALRTALQALGALRMEKYLILAAKSLAGAEQEQKRILGRIDQIEATL